MRLAISGDDFTRFLLRKLQLRGDMFGNAKMQRAGIDQCFGIDFVQFGFCVTCARLIDRIADGMRDADAFTRCLYAQSFMGIFFHCDGDFFHGVDWRIFCKP